MNDLHLDGETTSALELPTVGLHAYLTHPSTRGHCLAWAFDRDKPRIWRPGMPLEPEVHNHIKRGGRVFGHNVPFERLLLNCVTGFREVFPRVTIEQTYCTLSMCAAMAIPLDLERAVVAVGLKIRKSLRGKEVMKFLAKLDPDGSYRTREKYPALHDELEAYCCIDLEAERELSDTVLELSPRERQYWIMDQYINDRGVDVDEAAVQAAKTLVTKEEKRLSEEMNYLTNGYVSTVNCHAALREWIEAQGGPVLSGVGKDIVDDALELPEGDLPPLVRRALEIRHASAKSSTKKLNPMLVGRCIDGLMRGLLQFSGAGRTLRWSGRRAQIQNYPRQTELSRALINWFLEDPLRINVRVCQLMGLDPMRVVSQLLRGMLVSEPGTRFLEADLSQIEVRVAAWLAGDEDFLEEFRTRGKIYERDAAGIFGVPIESITKDGDMRQVGKVSGLAFQFGGGVNAFRNMGKNYKIPHFSDEQIETFKTGWRRNHPKIVAYWYELQNAAIAAVKNPGVKQIVSEYPRVVYLCKGAWLYCEGPDGSVAVYPHPRVEMLPTPWGELKPTLTYRTTDEEGKGENKEWVRVSTWGGKLFENLVQRVARGVFADKMLDAEDAGYRIVMHSHDAATTQMPWGRGSLAELCAIFAKTVAWAPDLPLGADGWESTRYQK